MPLGLAPQVTAALALALLGAAYVRGYSGFGFSAIFIACAALVTNPLPLIPVVFACEILMTVFQARGLRGSVEWRRVGALLLGAALTMPFAIHAILTVGEETARLLISALIFALALMLLSGVVVERRLGLLSHVGVGTASGMANAAGVGGLPVATFLSAQPLPAPVFRATMIVFLTGIDLMALPLMYRGGMVTGQTLHGILLAFPLLALGVWLGGRRFLSASPQEFRRFALILLLALSGAGLARGAIAWV